MAGAQNCLSSLAFDTCMQKTSLRWKCLNSGLIEYACFVHTSFPALPIYFPHSPQIIEQLTSKILEF
jgi:hypothetical protein